MNYAEISSIVRESLKCQVSDQKEHTPKFPLKSLSYTSTAAVDSVISKVSELEHDGSRTDSDNEGISFFIKNKNSTCTYYVLIKIHNMDTLKLYICCRFPVLYR